MLFVPDLLVFSLMMKFKYGLSYVIIVRAIMKEFKTMFVKGIKRGRTIELL